MAPDVARDLEVNFYRGAPAQWLNFYAAEQGKEEDAIIKRDGYEELHKLLSKGTAGVSEEPKDNRDAENKGSSHRLGHSQ
ncbi:hypothetical protein CRUP_032212 [Coryphaenoides rupestris]|nr:hypothetical protein CRUP_032212 [Coryphaenoides rupestris]